jgi:cell wall-associated NlpC family hydrolase
MSRIEYRLTALGILVFLLSGCLRALPGYGPEPLRSPAERRTVTSARAIQSALYAQFKDWQGVRHRSGGLSRSGVDCSGFVYLTYHHRFGINLPRTTRLQSRAGRYISRRDLQPGDLVFFKTGIFARHVGIYIEKDRFLHVSTKRGVMVSSLEDAYWRKRYWKAVRIPR